MTPGQLLRGKRIGALAILGTLLLCVSIGRPSVRITVPSRTCSELSTFHPTGALDCCRGSIAIPEGTGFRCHKRPKAIPNAKPVELTLNQSVTNNGNGKSFAVTLSEPTPAGTILYHLKRYDVLPSGESNRKLRAVRVAAAGTTTLEDTIPAPSTLLSIYRAIAYTQEGQLLARGHEVSVSLRSRDDSGLAERAVVSYFEKRRDGLRNAFRGFLSAKSQAQLEGAEQTMRNYNRYMRALSDFETTAIQKTFTQFDGDYRNQLREVFLNISKPKIEKPDFWATRGLEILDLFTLTEKDEANAASFPAALVRK
jgi:hypothetical protein